MKIVKLTAENFKRLRAVEIEPNGNIVQICGKNGSGKSSCLDAIMAALGGKEACPEVPIRRGESASTVTVDLGDLHVERRFTHGGTQLIVTDASGTRMASAQGVLDKLVGRLTFDPMSFLRQEQRQQSETLRQMVGLDFADVDADRKRIYDERTAVNRDVAQLEARGKAIVVPADAPDAEVDHAEVLRELDAAQLTNQQNAGVRERAGQLRASIEEQRQRVAELEQQLADAKTNLKARQDKFTDCASSAAALADVDEAPIRAKLAGLKTANDGARAKAQRRDIARQYRQRQADTAALTKRLDDLDATKAQRLAAAKFPVAELALDGAGQITYRGLPLAQASSAEQLRVSMAMALALNPTLRVALIRDGSLLDSHSLAVVAELAAERDAQVWIEQVDETGAVGVVIEDGAVKAVHP